MVNPNDHWYGYLTAGPGTVNPDLSGDVGKGPVEPVRRTIADIDADVYKTIRAMLDRACPGKAASMAALLKKPCVELPGLALAEALRRAAGCA